MAHWVLTILLFLTVLTEWGSLLPLDPQAGEGGQQKAHRLGEPAQQKQEPFNVDKKKQDVESDILPYKPNNVDTSNEQINKLMEMLVKAGEEMAKEMDSMFGSGAGDLDSGDINNLPSDYHNETHSEEIVNGTEIDKNRTIDHKGNSTIITEDIVFKDKAGNETGQIQSKKVSSNSPSDLPDFDELMDLANEMSENREESGISTPQDNAND